MKNVPLKIVILVVIGIVTLAAIWISIGSRIGSMDQYPADDPESGMSEAALTKIGNLQLSCSNLNTSFQVMNDFLITLEREGLLVNEKSTEAWKGFGDAYLGNYIDCKINHFRNDMWYANELIEANQHLALWKQRYPVSQLSQVTKLNNIRSEYLKFQKTTGVYRDEDQAIREIAQMKQYTSNVYLQNCVTVQNNVRSFQNSMGNSHIDKVVAKAERYNDPNNYFGDRYEFNADVNKCNKMLQEYLSASMGNRYGNTHPKSGKVTQAEDLINYATWR